MLKLYHIIVLSYILMVFILLNLSEANSNEPAVRERGKRYIRFKNSSVFFIRLNFKANMIWWTQIFAHATGFRMNWAQAPDTFHPYHRLIRRDVYNHLAALLDRSGLNGSHCIRRAICEMQTISEPMEIYHKILKIVFRNHSSVPDKWSKITLEDCECSASTCPVSALDVIQYTDI